MKRFIKMIPVVMMSLAVCILPVFAMAEVDTKATGTVILKNYPADNSVFDFYKVADVDEKMYMTLTGKYAPYASEFEINIANADHAEAQKTWAETTDTLARLTEGEGISPDKSFSCTDGVWRANDLEVGLYLVLSKPARKGNYTYWSLPMLVSIPVNFDDPEHAMDPADIPYIQETDEWIYEYEINIKYDCKEIPQQNYRVVKEWVNDGDGKTRPVNLEVRILKDGEVAETIKLNTSNNWTYSWTGDADAVYSVQEVKVPAGYTVSYSDNKTVFTIRNKYKEPPNTSDTTDLKWPMIGLCVGGAIALIAGIILLRDKKQSQ